MRCQRLPNMLTAGLAIVERTRQAIGLNRRIYPGQSCQTVPLTHRQNPRSQLRIGTLRAVVSDEIS